MNPSSETHPINSEKQTDYREKLDRINPVNLKRLSFELDTLANNLFSLWENQLFILDDFEDLCEYVTGYTDPPSTTEIKKCIDSEIMQHKINTLINNIWKDSEFFEIVNDFSDGIERRCIGLPDKSLTPEVIKKNKDKLVQLKNEIITILINHFELMLGKAFNKEPFKKLLKDNGDTFFRQLKLKLFDDDGLPV